MTRWHMHICRQPLPRGLGDHHEGGGGMASPDIKEANISIHYSIHVPVSDVYLTIYAHRHSFSWARLDKT